MSVGTTLKRSLRLGQLGVDLYRSQRQPEGPGRQAARRLVAARLGRLRGLPQKIGQIVSLRELESETSVFADLTDAATPMPAAEAFALIEGELGAPIATVFRRLDEQGAAASLGQVHRGELHDGRPIAVKVQYPGIRETLDADLAALGWMAAPLSAHRSGFDLNAYRSELRASLLDELDYGLEARALKRAVTHVADVPGVVTPVPIDRYCTARVLTMTWVGGAGVRQAARWPEPARAEAARLLLRFFLRGCLTWRELHADPHPGNVRFDLTDGRVQLGVLDFGCVKSMREAEAAALARLCRDGREMTDAALLDAYLSLGFKETLLSPISPRLRDVTAVLCEPFLSDGSYDVRTWRVSERLAAALGDDRWNFRFAGPASLLYFIRALQGLIQYITLLGARIDWRGELLTVAPPTARLATVDPAPVYPLGREAGLTGASMNGSAGKLRLQVVKGGESVVQLTFPAAAVAHLQDLVPDEMHARIRERGVDLTAIASTATAAGCPPGDLFTLDERDVIVRVWLE